MKTKKSPPRKKQTASRVAGCCCVDTCACGCAGWGCGGKPLVGIPEGKIQAAGARHTFRLITQKCLLRLLRASSAICQSASSPFPALLPLRVGTSFLGLLVALEAVKLSLHGVSWQRCKEAEHSPSLSHHTANGQYAGNDDGGREVEGNDAHVQHGKALAEERRARGRREGEG